MDSEAAIHDGAELNPILDQVDEHGVRRYLYKFKFYDGVIWHHFPMWVRNEEDARARLDIVRQTLSEPIRLRGIGHHSPESEERQLVDLHTQNESRA
ncbi:hypothetical protein [Shinella sp. M27]|uniref:hypothetical protein n=1 Tax=Shinella sp. M27 TaxID=3368614 RepID=UPI003B9DCCA3